MKETNHTFVALPYVCSILGGAEHDSVLTSFLGYAKQKGSWTIYMKLRKSLLSTEMHISLPAHLIFQEVSSFLRLFSVCSRLLLLISIIISTELILISTELISSILSNCHLACFFSRSFSGIYFSHYNLASHQKLTPYSSTLSLSDTTSV